MKTTWSPIFLIFADKNCREQFNLRKQKLRNSKDAWKAGISSKTLQEKKTLKFSEIYQIRHSEADEAMSPMPDFDSCTGIVLFTWQCIYHAPISTHLKVVPLLIKKKIVAFKIQEKLNKKRNIMRRRPRTIDSRDRKSFLGFINKKSWAKGYILLLIASK